MEFSSLLPSLKSRPLTQSSQTPPLVAITEVDSRVTSYSPKILTTDTPLQLIHSNFSLGTWMLLGACTQACLALLVRNRYYAFLPPGILLSFRIIDALLIHFQLKKNPFLQNAILKKRFSAMVPDQDGVFRGPGQEKVVILLLGAKSNHPFGFLAPEFLKTFKWVAEMNAEFDKQDGPNGCKHRYPLDHQRMKASI